MSSQPQIGILDLLEKRGLKMNVPIKAIRHTRDRFYDLPMLMRWNPPLGIEIYQRYPIRRYFPAEYDHQEKYLVTFIGAPRSGARFLGVYNVAGPPLQPFDPSIPAVPSDYPYPDFHKALNNGPSWYYDLRRVPGFEDLLTVVVYWSSPIKWHQWLVKPDGEGGFERNDKPVI
jgi:hypothetical protein